MALSVEDKTKREAKELVNRFMLPITQHYVEQDKDVSKREISTAKQCALIAVEYLIEETYYEIKNDSRKPLSHREYWQQVKQFIEKM